MEELVRYCARPPLANDRLEKHADGHYVLRLKTRWRDGTTHLKFEPIELMERLAAQIPKLRANLVLYAGRARAQFQVEGPGGALRTTDAAARPTGDRDPDPGRA